MTQPKLTYVLPALVDSGPMDDPKAAGAWLKIERLGALTEALKVGAQTLRRDDIKSIPDPWAQPLLFERALIDENHPLHEAVRTQWRALIATLGLQAEFAGVYSISIANVAIDRSSLFRRVLKELEPVRALHPDMNWSQQSLLIFREQAGDDAFAFSDGKTLGFISPTTLFAAVQGVENIRCAAIPWLSDGLSDPAKAALAPRHFRILADYINRIAMGLRDTADLDPKLKPRLLEELKRFYEACNEQATTVQNLKDYPLPLDWPTRLHQELLGLTRTYEAEARPPSDSEAMLRMTPSLAKVVNGAVLIDAALADTLRKPPQAISVWGRYSLAEALQPATLSAIRREAEEAGWLIVTPDDLFSQALVGFDPSTRIEAHQGDFVSALLPLTPLALMLMSPTELARSAQLQRGPSEATALLTLKLENGGSHAVRKTLPIVSSEAPNDLSFWPNFRSPGWRWTYFHFSGNPTYQVRPRFAITSNFIAEEATYNCLNEGDKVRRLRRWFEPSVGGIDAQFGFSPSAPRFSEIRVGDRRLLQRVGFYATEQSVGEMHHLSDGADAIFFARQLDNGDYVTVGLSLVKFQEPASASVGASTVAIDFGTTNTVVYRKRSNVIERVDFSDRVLFPFGIREKEEKRRQDLIELYTTFFPLKTHESPFPTVAKLREFRPSLPPELQREVDAGKIESHGLSDAIFFVPNFEGFLQWHAKLNPGENLYLDWTERGILKFRLKWGESASMRAMAARFLRQTMMMTAAETVAGGGSVSAIDWRFSFPQAFKPRERAQLEREIDAGWTELFGDIADRPEAPFLRKAEGLAAGHYFLRLGDRMPDRLMMILDIGGGTTDIALWKDEKPVWRNSLKVAGGDFFTAYLANNIELLRDIDLSDVADSLSQASRLDEEGRRDFVELFVNKPNFNTKFAAGFRRLSAEPIGEGLRQVALVALGGLMYYVGLIIRRLIDDPDSPIEEADLNRLTIGFAGRGSTLFRQLGVGAQDDELIQVLKIAVAAAGGDEDKAQLSTRFSDVKEAKHEVAKGLLVDVTADPTVRERRFAVLGEAINIHGREGPATLEASDDLASLAAGPRFDDLELEHLQKVLSAIRRLTGVGIDIKTLGGLDEIRNRVRSQLRTSLDQLDADAFDDRDSQPFEPPFVIALRELVRLMAQNLETRDRFLVVREA